MFGFKGVDPAKYRSHNRRTCLCDAELAKTGIGTRRLRKEDPPLLTGESKFIDDLNLPGALWLALVRSTEAHAEIKKIDTKAALAVDGVQEVLTGADLAPL